MKVSAFYYFGSAVVCREDIYFLTFNVCRLTFLLLLDSITLHLENHFFYSWYFTSFFQRSVT